jgi:hypothetical protein
MPSGKPHQTSHEDSLHLLVGRLLATTEAASEGISALSEETKANSKAIVAVATTLDVMAKTVNDLVKLVRDGNGKPSLILQMQEASSTMTELKRVCDELAEQHEGMTVDLSKFRHEHSRVRGGKRVLWNVVYAIGWLITTGIALAALYWR